MVLRQVFFKPSNLVNGYILIPLVSSDFYVAFFFSLRPDCALQTAIPILQVPSSLLFC